MFVNLPTSNLHIMLINETEIRDFLDTKYKQYNNKSYIASDPIQVPHKFSKKADIEIGAFLAAQLAWGNRKAIIKSVSRLIDHMDNSPYEWLRYAKESDYKIFDNFVYRTFNSTDTKFFLSRLSEIINQYTTLGNFFEKIYRHTGNDIKLTLQQFRALFMEGSPLRTSRHMGDISRGSAVKRLNMFLRWMVRDDKKGVDFGIWKFIRPSELYIPLDVHSGRVARKLGLLDRKTDDWKAVNILTERLRDFDSEDPVKYDFALFGLGVFESF